MMSTRTEELFEVNFDRRLGKGSENDVYEASLTTRYITDDGDVVSEETCKVAAKSLFMLLQPDDYGLDSADAVKALFRGQGQLAVLLREVEEHKRLCNGTPPPEMVRFRRVQYETLHGVEVPKWVVQELCEGGTLEQRLASVRGSGKEALLPREVYDILVSVVRCLEYIHESGSIHRDIKPANILFSGDGRVKIGDFGFLRRTCRGQQTACGTPMFVAPEVCTGTYDQTADIYSLAIVVMLMSGIAERRIVDARDRAARGDKSALELIVGGLVAEFPYLQPVLQTVLRPAAERPSARELMVKLSLGEAGRSGAASRAEELVWSAPPYYTCCCDDGDDDDDGGCNHKGEPASDHDWVFCACCADGSQIYHASCFNDCHKPKHMRGHKAKARQLPPIMPIQFGAVLDKFVGSEANLVTYVGSCLRPTALISAGGREVVDFGARKVMWEIACEEVRNGQASSALYRSPVFQGFLGELTSSKTSVARMKSLVTRSSCKVKLANVAEPLQNSEACLKEAMGVRLDKQLAEMGKNLQGQCFSKQLLKSNMATSALFASFELGYTLYSHWSSGEIDWNKFRVEAAQIISGHVVSGVGSWAGMSAAVAIVVAASGGPITIAISGMIGAVAGGAIGQVAGRYAAGKAVELAQTDFSKENAQAVVLAMDALNVYVDDPKDLMLHHVKKAYCHMALDRHPDKIHKRDGETNKAFQVRKAQANIQMSMLTHHYNVLKAYIEQRDSSTVWTRVQANAAHSVGRMWADVKKQKDKKFTSFGA